MEGLTQMIEVIRDVMQTRPSQLQFGGIVLTMYDHTLELTHEVDEEVRDFFGEIVFQTVIPRDVAVAEAPSHGKSVIDYAPRARGPGHTWNFAWRYSNVTKEKRLGRGLEALLGRLPRWSGGVPAAGPQPQPPPRSTRYDNAAAAYDAALDPFGSYAVAFRPGAAAAPTICSATPRSSRSPLPRRVRPSRVRPRRLAAGQDRQQPLPAAAGLRSEGDRSRWPTACGPRAVAAGRGPPHGRAATN